MKYKILFLVLIFIVLLNFNVFADINYLVEGDIVTNDILIVNGNNLTGTAMHNSLKGFIDSNNLIVVSLNSGMYQVYFISANDGTTFTTSNIYMNNDIITLIKTGGHSLSGSYQYYSSGVVKSTSYNTSASTSYTVSLTAGTTVLLANKDIYSDSTLSDVELINNFGIKYKYYNATSYEFDDYAYMLMNEQDAYNYTIRLITVETDNNSFYQYKIALPIEQYNDNFYDYVMNVDIYDEVNPGQDYFYLFNYVSDIYDTTTFYPLFYSYWGNTDLNYVSPQLHDMLPNLDGTVINVVDEDISGQYIYLDNSESYFNIVDVEGNDITEITRFISDTYDNYEYFMINLKVPKDEDIETVDDILEFIHVGNDGNHEIIDYTLTMDSSYVYGFVKIKYEVWLNHNYILECNYKYGYDITRFLYDYISMDVSQYYYDDSIESQNVDIDNFWGDADNFTDKLDYLVDRFLGIFVSLKNMTGSISAIFSNFFDFMPTELTMLFGVGIIAVIFMRILGR